MPRLVAIIFVFCLAACRTPPLDFDGGVPGADLAGSGGGGGVGGGGGGGGAFKPDLSMSVTDMHAPPTSCCGVAGNPGNELGVGAFCQSSTECAGHQANICATAFSPMLTFCTKQCMMNGNPTECGSGAQCQCAGAMCACIPGECVMPPPGC